MMESDVAAGLYGSSPQLTSDTSDSHLDMDLDDGNVAGLYHVCDLAVLFARLWHSTTPFIAGPTATGKVPVAALSSDVSGRRFRYVDLLRVNNDPIWFSQEPPTLVASGVPEAMLPNSASLPLEEIAGVARGSTVLEHVGPVLDRGLFEWFVELVRDASQETFFDGMDNAFRLQAGQAIEFYGDLAVCALDQAIADSSASVEVIEEALRFLGDLNDQETHYRRLSVLLKALSSSNPRVRDAASVGLASLGDPAAKDSICTAIAREQFDQLRSNLRSALNSL